MVDFKTYIKQKLLLINDQIGNISVVKPPKEDMGDYSVACFTLNVKDLKNSNEKAKYLANNLRYDKDIILTVYAMGPYLNFLINKETLATNTIRCILEKKEKFGSSNKGIGKNLLIEHTSINPNASPHIGRARNSILGDFLVHLYKFEGYNVETHYFINDIGKQIAMLLVGIQEKNIFSSVTFEDMLSLYVEINEQSKLNPEIEKKAFYYLHELENGNKDVRDQFKNITNICVEGQKNIFEKLNITWDKYMYESDFVFDNRTTKILDKLKRCNRLKEDKSGRYYVTLEEYEIPTKTPVLILTREDKTSLYPLRDIVYTIYKMKLNPENNYIVLGEDQEVYMKQISAVLDILGYKAPKLISYSFVLLNGNKMATREGKVVLLKDFIKEAEKKIANNFIKKNQKLNRHKISAIASSCIKYSMLNVNRKRNVNFNLEEATNFQGNSAMYLLYNYVRICSILDKTRTNPNCKCFKFNENIEFLIISYLYEFPEIIQKSLHDQESIVITNYLYNLTQLFSKYYEMIPILKEKDIVIRNARLLLLECIKIVLENGMDILGIEKIKQL